VVGRRRPIAVAIDPDPAGRAAALSAWELLTAAGATNLLHIALPDGKDPAELVRNGRGQMLRDAITGHRPLAFAVADLHRPRQRDRRRWGAEAPMDRLAIRHAATDTAQRGRTETSCRADLMTISGQDSSPSTGTFMTAYGQFLVAADIRGHSPRWQVLGSNQRGDAGRFTDRRATRL